jgi:selenocysteine lyase/cysteine desulfurase
MAIMPLPAGTDATLLQAELYDKYQIEIPGIRWNGRAFLRISVQVYNTATDLGRLIAALSDYFDNH